MRFFSLYLVTEQAGGLGALESDMFKLPLHLLLITSLCRTHTGAHVCTAYSAYLKAHVFIVPAALSVELLVHVCFCVGAAGERFLPRGRIQGDRQRGLNMMVNSTCRHKLHYFKGSHLFLYFVFSYYKRKKP